MQQPIWISRKRTLGLAFIAAGVLGAIGILLLDIVRTSDQHGIGPAQKLALVGCVGISLLGVTLALLGIDPICEPKSESAILPAAPRTLLWTRRLLLGAAALLMVFHLVIFVMYALSLASFPFDYDQGEGFELNDTVLLSQGQSPYRNNEVYPFYASNYPPLYHIVLVPFVWLFGPQYWYGRLAGFAATLIIAAAIAYAIHRETRHRLVAALAGLAFVASNYVYQIGPLFRQHIFMVMLETLAVVIIAGIDFNAEPRSQRKRLIIGLVFLLAAGFTKQLAIATAAAIFVYLFLNSPRRAIAWGVVFAAIAGAIFLTLNVITGGQWWLNIVTANVNQYILSQFKGLVSQFIGLHGALLIMAILFALYELYFDRLSLYTIWFAAAAVDAVLAGKWGAGDSYFTTMIAAMCILAGIFTARCLKREWRLPSRLSDALKRFATPLTPNPFPPRKRRERGAESPSLLAGDVSNAPKPSPLIAQLSQVVTPFIGLIACLLFVLYGLAVFHIPLQGPIFAPLAQVLRVQSNTKFANFYDSAGWTMGYGTIGQMPSAEDVASGWQIVAAVKDDPRPILSEEAAFSFHTGKPVVSNPTQLLNLYQNGHYNPDALVKMIHDQAFGAVIYRAGFYPEPVLAAVKRAYKGSQQINMNGYQYTILVPDPFWNEKQTF
jgi:hypothetical protein